MASDIVEGPPGVGVLLVAARLDDFPHALAARRLHNNATAATLPGLYMAGDRSGLALAVPGRVSPVPGH
jgi:hypothetical protein